MVPHFATDQAPDPRDARKSGGFGWGLGRAAPSRGGAPGPFSSPGLSFPGLEKLGPGDQMSRVSLRLGFALLVGLTLLVGFGCSHETFDLLPQADEAPQAGMAGGGRVGFGGTGPGTGGRGGTDGLPIPDYPTPLSVDCRACRTHSDCEIGTICDLARDYCAPYCG